MASESLIALDCPLQDRREKESFFNFFYLSINLGSLLAVTVLVYIQDNIRSGYIIFVSKARNRFAVLCARFHTADAQPILQY